jgi:hypothetical protein
MTDDKNKQGASNMPHKHPRKVHGKNADDTDEAVVRKGAEIENPDMPGPDKKIELDDNPDETKRKIPNL